jgi:hypothetical protein
VLEKKLLAQIWCCFQLQPSANRIHLVTAARELGIQNVPRT